MEQLQLITSMLGNMATKDDLAEVRRDVAEVKGDLAEVKKDVAGVKADISSLQDGQTEIKADISNLQDGQQRLDGKLTGLQQGQADLKAQMQEGFRQNREAIAEVVDVVGKKIYHLEGVVKDVQGATAQTAYELQMLKSKAQ